MEHNQTSECPQDELAQALAQAQADDQAGVSAVRGLIGDYPQDPRLHFLLGSLLAGLKHYPDGEAAMARAVEIAPGYGLARFQLGFLQLTSGNAEAALETLAPLETLPDDEPLRLFAAGLRHLIGDEFDACVAALTRGIALNNAVPAMNKDMQLLIDQVSALPSGGDQPAAQHPPETTPAPAAAEPVSATHLLLRQYRNKDRH